MNKHANIFSASLGFSAGAMLYASMAEILIKAQKALQDAMGDKKGAAATAAAFFAGMLLIGLIDRSILRKDKSGLIRTGLAEPIGATIGYLILMPFLGGILCGLFFAGISGVMVFVSLDKLLPAARKYGAHRLSDYGMLAGMAVMAVSLLLLM